MPLYAVRRADPCTGNRTEPGPIGRDIIRSSLSPHSTTNPPPAELIHGIRYTLRQESTPHILRNNQYTTTLFLGSNRASRSDLPTSVVKEHLVLLLLLLPVPHPSTPARGTPPWRRKPNVNLLHLSSISHPSTHLSRPPTTTSLSRLLPTRASTNKHKPTLSTSACAHGRRWQKVFTMGDTRAGRKPPSSH